MNNTEPIVSVVIPCFNTEKYLAEAIKSVIDQSYIHWEILVVDDGSEDDSVSIAKNYAEMYPNIYAIQRNRIPKGGNTCRNIGLMNAKGKYVIFLDADDMLAEWCLYSRVKEMEQHTECDFIVFKMQTFITVIPKTFELKKRYISADPLAHFIALDCIWQITSPIWKRSFLMQINGFNEDYQRLQDVELAFRALTFQNVQFSLHMINNIDCYYRKGVKPLNKEFWGKGFIQVQKYLLQVNNWIQNDIKSRKHYLKYLNRTTWNYLLYFWRSNEVTTDNVQSFIKSIRKNEIISKTQYMIMNCIINSNSKIIRNVTLFHKTIEQFIRLMKSQFSKNLFN